MFTKNPVQLVLVVGIGVLGLANILVSVMAFSVDVGERGVSELWQHPNGFALGTMVIALACFGFAYYVYQKRIG